MRPARWLASLLLVLAGAAALADVPNQVVVDDPYLELHTGPGRGYPIFHVIERGELVTVLKRRTDWFRVEDAAGRSGWVHRRQLEQTILPGGGEARVVDVGFEQYADSHWELGFLAGDFGGANVISTYGAFAFTRNLSVELQVSQVLGNFSNSYLGTLSATHVLFPDWRVTPFFQIGTGAIHTKPKATLVETTDRTDQVALVGFGFRGYVTQRFVLRSEYKSYVVLTSRDENEEIDEWKVGFAFFF
jgi:hypothetical protein